MKNKISLIIFAVTVFLIAIASAFLASCKSTVGYKEYTGNVKCDIAIMTAIIKSKPGYEAFEVQGFIDACFSDLDRTACKDDHFKTDPVSYDRRDERYISYLACLGDKK